MCVCSWSCSVSAVAVLYSYCQFLPPSLRRVHVCTCLLSCLCVIVTWRHSVRVRARVFPCVCVSVHCAFRSSFVTGSVTGSSRLSSPAELRMCGGVADVHLRVLMCCTCFVTCPCSVHSLRGRVVSCVRCQNGRTAARDGRPWQHHHSYSGHFPSPPTFHLSPNMEHSPSPPSLTTSLVLRTQSFITTSLLLRTQSLYHHWLAVAHLIIY